MALFESVSAYPTGDGRAGVVEQSVQVPGGDVVGCGYHPRRQVGVAEMLVDERFGLAQESQSVSWTSGLAVVELVGQKRAQELQQNGAHSWAVGGPELARVGKNSANHLSEQHADSGSAGQRPDHHFSQVSFGQRQQRARHLENCHPSACAVVRGYVGIEGM
nr:hypothetical protein [Nonomuraea spiralis]